MEEISSLHSELVSLPALPSRATRAYNSAKKMDACLLGVSMDADTLSSEVEIASQVANESLLKKRAYPVP